MKIWNGGAGFPTKIWNGGAGFPKEFGTGVHDSLGNLERGGGGGAEFPRELEGGAGYSGCRNYYPCDT